MLRRSTLVTILLLAVAVAVTAEVSAKKSGGSSDARDQIVDSLKQDIVALKEAQDELTAQWQKTAADLKELQNRQIVRQKSQDELLTSAVARVAPKVVSIVVSRDVPLLEVSYENPFGNDPFFKDFGVRIPVYRQKGVQKQKVGAGTGFFVTSDGHILTNRHVVADVSADYTALLSDGKQLPARVVYRDPVQDAAIVKVEGAGYGTVSLGDSGALRLGQTVAAIGNALGEYGNTVSVGIISGLDRTIEASDGSASQQLRGVIQTDAAINPGNSGGPLLDLAGQVVGVNVATVIGSSNISFAVPINTVKNIIKSALGK